jgi:hypothetical protein
MAFYQADVRAHVGKYYARHFLLPLCNKADGNEKVITEFGVPIEIEHTEELDKYYDEMNGNKDLNTLIMSTLYLNDNPMHPDEKRMVLLTPTTTKLVHNFLNLLDTHEVVLTSATPQKKWQHGEAVRKKYVPQTDVKLSLPLREYMQRVHEYERVNGRVPKAHWVRGHYNHWRAERYKTIRGRKTYVAPFIRGLGEPRVKPYEVDTSRLEPEVEDTRQANMDYNKHD